MVPPLGIYPDRVFCGMAKLVDAFGRPFPNSPDIPTAADCTHEKCQPVFDAEAAEGLHEAEVRKRWPRVQGTCPDCNQMVILYASARHFIAGDW